MIKRPKELRMLSRLITLVSVATIAGCSSMGMNTSAAAIDFDQSSLVPFCSIAGEPKSFVGKIIATRATYSVVKNYDSYFSGDDCPQTRRIAEGSRQDVDKSVLTFYRAGDRLCKDRKIESLCSLQANVVIAIRLSIDDNGEIVADPIHIKSFSYLP